MRYERTEGAATWIPITVMHRDGTALVNVNQQQLPWPSNPGSYLRSLGSFQFNIVGGAVVINTKSTDLGLVVYTDSFKFVNASSSRARRSSACGGLVPICNAGFESPKVNLTHMVAVAPTCWTVEGAAGVYAPGPNSTAAADGVNVAWAADGVLRQTLTVTPYREAQYTLRVRVSRSRSARVAYAVRLLLHDTVLVADEGRGLGDDAMTELELVASVPAVHGRLRLELEARGGTARFDNVRLDFALPCVQRRRRRARRDPPHNEQ